jgi:hypothetical protein
MALQEKRSAGFGIVVAWHAFQWISRFLESEGGMYGRKIDLSLPLEHELVHLFRSYVFGDFYGFVVGAFAFPASLEASTMLCYCTTSKPFGLSVCSWCDGLTLSSNLSTLNAVLAPDDQHLVAVDFWCD